MVNARDFQRLTQTNYKIIYVNSIDSNFMYNDFLIWWITDMKNKIFYGNYKLFYIHDSRYIFC